MKKVLSIIAGVMCVIMCGVSAMCCISYAEMAAQVEEVTDANERLAQMYMDIEAENNELKELNLALANQKPQIEYVEVPQVVYQTEYIEVPAQDDFVECGACGAHVHNWYYVTSMDGQDLVEVCEYCYQAYLDYYE